MHPLMVVELEIVVQPLLDVAYRLVIMKKNVLILHGTPKSLNKEVIQRLSSPVYTDLNPTV